MNLKKSKKISAKIYNMLNEMDQADDLSSIEHALVLKYVVNLYEELKEATTDTDTKPKKKKERKVLITKKKGPAPTSPKKTIEAEAKEEEMNETTKTKPVEKVANETPIIDENIQFLDELIQSMQGKDLADRLSLQPIEDIFKSMSINERIFTINELFEGREDTFKSCLQELNAASSIDTAKKILIETAVIPFNWNDPKKVKKVSKFVQLLYRKFL